MGWGPINYSVPLSAKGKLPATHYGLHAWVEQSFVDMIDAVKAGHAPEVPGMPQSDVELVVANLIMSVQEGSGYHWQTVLSDNGLMVAQSDEI